MTDTPINTTSSATPPPRPAVLHADGKMRCPWPGADPFYIAYHDTEWGMPEWDSRALFEKLILDGFQAGLSWITILRKREAFRRAFDGFEPAVIARYDAAKAEALMQDAGIVRNRGKIVSTIASARVYLDIEAREGFSNYLWNFLEGRVIRNSWKYMGEVPPATPLSQTMSKDLKRRGFNFCGPTIVYAFMQATGMVNDHLTGCFRYEECAALAQRRPS